MAKADNDTNTIINKIAIENEICFNDIRKLKMYIEIGIKEIMVKIL